MTAIAGLVNNGVVWMGGDNLGSDWHLNCANTAFPKVFTIGPYVIGYSGAYRLGQVLQYAFDLQDDERETNAMRFMVVNFVHRLRQVLHDHGTRRTLDGVETIAGWATCLVGFRGRLFQVDDHFQVLERSDGFDACGCGGQLCLASLYETRDRKMGPEARLTRALETAERFSAGVRRPFTILKLPNEK